MTKITWNHRSLASLVCLASAVLVYSLCGKVNAAQEVSPAQQTAPTVSEEQIQSHITKVQQADSLDDDTRKKALDFCNAALEQVKLGKDWSAKAVEYEKVANEAPALLARSQMDAGEPLKQPKPDIRKDASLADLEQQLAAAETDLASAKAKRDELQKEPARRVERTKQLPALITDAAKRLSDAQAQLQSTPPDEPAEVAQARQMLNQARVEAIQAEKATYEKEMAGYDARTGLLLLQQDMAAAEVTQKEALVKEWRQVVARTRQNELQRAALDTQKAILEASQAGPTVRQYAENLAAGNAELLNRRTGPDGLVMKAEKATELLDTLESQLASVKASFEDVRVKTETVGLSNAVGLLLRNTLDNLPDLREHRNDLKDRSEEIAAIQMEQFSLQEKRIEASDIDGTLDSFFGKGGSEVDAGQRRVLRELMVTRRNYLSALATDSANHLNTLLNIQMKEQQLIDVTEELAAFISERVMWVRSTHPFHWSDIPATWATLLWLLHPQQWLELAASLEEDFLLNWSSYVFALLVFIALYIAGQRAARKIDSLAEDARQQRFPSFSPSLKTLLLTGVVTIPWPAFLGLCHWRMAACGNAFAGALANGFLSAAIVLSILAFIRQLMRENGLAEVYFSWPVNPLKAFRRHLGWLTVFSLLCVFVISVMESTGDEPKRASLGRLAFLVAAVAYAAFAHTLFQRRKGPLRSVVNLMHGANGKRLCDLGYAAGILIPGALALLACAGWYYTAVKLNWRLFNTAAFGLALLLARGMALHAFDIARRCHHLEERRRQALLRKKEGDDTTEPEEEQEEKIDWGGVDAQTRSFLKSLTVVSLIMGTWLIWADVLPALSFLNRVELWQNTRAITQTVKDASGQLISTAQQKVVPVTLAHLCLTLLIVFLTSVFVRNLPGILEVAVLQRLPLIAGERYAINTVLRYSVILVGTIAAFRALGVDWSSVQWLVAAFGVGLGFGLQEIFANFVSGLVILFERPVRVGDTVTIGGVSGTVSRIRMRATHITDWDLKELVVPNKEFVTGQLVNWTLSDAMLRVVVPVGIAYGSDTEKAVQTLERVAIEHPLVLADPAPRAFFLGFGASSLDFELRAYSPSIEHLLQIKHELHMAVEKAFREEHIEIAFPQQDIHVRSINPLLPLIEQRNKMKE